MERQLIVAAGTHDRELCPVQATVPEVRAAMAVRLFEADSGSEVPCQAGHGTVEWVLSGLSAGAVRRYRLVVGDGVAAAPTCELRDSDGSLDVVVGGQLFARYNYAATLPRPFFHPVIGPGERRVTRAYPMETVEGESTDHVHHRGIWVAHGDVNGVDDWSEAPGHGRILHRAFEETTSGPVSARFRETLDWVSGEGVHLLAERREVATYALLESERLLDVTVRLTATEGTVTFGDTKEAGLISVRVASSMEGKRGGLIENGFGGVRESETWGKTAPWCHYTGLVAGEPIGIGILDHPTNPRFPTNWHVRDYGLFTANPFGLHDFFPGTDRDGRLTVGKGETVTFRYRILIHCGDAAAGRLEQRFADFATPPAVGVE